MLIDRMAAELGFARNAILEFARRATHLYKTYTIKKRGSEDRRIISHPARELKVLQKWLATRLFHKLPVHDCVYSYRIGVSIGEHANIHRTQRYLLRVDLADFFPSITQAAIRQLLHANAVRFAPPLSEHDIELILRIVCKGNALTIGAPSSPILSNAVLYPFDLAWADRARSSQVIYTRYADDLYFSTNVPNLLAQILKDMPASLRALAPLSLRINTAKTTFTSKKRKRVVTGLVLTSTDRLSVGRAQKRYIRSLVQRFANGALSPEDVSYLKGYLSYVANVEPTFLGSLARKYGEPALTRIANVPNAPRKVHALRHQRFPLAKRPST